MGVIIDAVERFTEMPFVQRWWMCVGDAPLSTTRCSRLADRVSPPPPPVLFRNGTQLKVGGHLAITARLHADATS